MTKLSDPSKALPSSEESEKALISCIMQAPRLIDSLTDQGATRDLFHMPAHGDIWQAAVELHQQGEPVEMASLGACFTASPEIFPVLAECYNMSISPGSYGHYHRDLVKLRRRREIALAGNAAVESAMNDTAPPSDIVDAFTAALEHHATGARRLNISTGKQLALAAMDRIQQATEKRPGELDGIHTGFTGLDRLTLGLRRGWLAIIAARPGMGKTAIGLGIALNAALGRADYSDVKRDPAAVLFVSLEMSAEELTDRIFAAALGCPLAEIRGQKLTPAQMVAVQSEAKALVSGRLEIMDGRGVTIQQLAGRIRRRAKEKPLDLIVVDYLSLISSTSQQGRGTREREVAEVAMGLKSIAREHNVAVVALAQLNREVDQRSSEKAASKPKLSDLRESGQIEQEADLVAFIHRPSASQSEPPKDFNPNAPSGLHTVAEKEDWRRQEWESIASLLIRKNRHGGTAEIPLRWHGPTTRFTSKENRFLASK